MNCVFFHFFIQMYQMFSIAIGDKWCSVVPQSWLIMKDKLCVWPPQGTKNVSKLIKKCASPETSWDIISYKYLMGPFDSFEIAKSKEKDAELVSSDDAKFFALQNKMDLSPTRNKKKPKKYDSFENNSTEEESSETHSEEETISYTQQNKRIKVTKQKKTIPNPPSNYIKKPEKSNINKKQDEDRELSREKNTQLSSEFDIPESQPLYYGDSSFFTEDYVQNKDEDKQEEDSLQLKKPIVKHIHYNPANISRITVHKTGIAVINESNKGDKNNPVVEDAVPNETNILKRTNGDHCSAEPRSLQQEKYLQMINGKLDNIMRKLDTILAFHDEGMPLAHSSPDLLPLFPLKSTVDFKTFCENLEKDEDLRKQFQKRIRSMGGKSAENHLRNCLITTLSNELAKQLTWEGQRQTVGIKSTVFANIIIGTILNMYSKSDMYSLKVKFCEWLRRGSDRYRYELKKSL